MRVALLLQWRRRGHSRPSYGLIDDEELLRTGQAIFLGTDGLQFPATHDDLLLMQEARDDATIVHAAKSAC